MVAIVKPVRQAHVTNIEIRVINPHDPRGVFGESVSLADCMCRPGSMERDIRETIIEAAELLQEHAPYLEGDIDRCYVVIDEALRECGKDGMVVRDLDHGAQLQVKVSQGPGFII